MAVVQEEKQFVKISKEILASKSGSKIVHISLVDVDDVPIRAIVGRELSQQNVRGKLTPREMSYAVTEKFIEHVGLDKSKYTKRRWTSTRDVYGWLNKHFLSNPPSDQSAAETLLDAETTRMGNSEGEEAKSIEDSLPSGDIELFGCIRTDNEGSQYYSAFRRNGITISAHSFIYVWTTYDKDVVAYIKSLYQTRDSKKEMKVIWLHKKEDIYSDKFFPVAHAREVFMSKTYQTLALETCNGVATVLTWDHYRRCSPFVLTGQVEKPCFCRRLFHADGHVEAFDIGTLKGYWDQHTLSVVGIKQVAEATIERGLREARKQRSLSVEGIEVEVLSEESGWRGCWFRCHVVKEKVKLKFQDINVVDTVKNLEGWHSIGTVAASDKFRAPGRWTIRPPPPKVDVTPADEPGTAVDVQLENCWCEGILMQLLPKGKARVYLPEKKDVELFHTSRLRISKDWVNGDWNNLARANISGKVSFLHCERIFTSQVLKLLKRSLRSLFLTWKQISLLHVPVTKAKTEATEIREEVLFNYSK